MQKEIIDKLNSGLQGFTIEIDNDERDEFEKALASFGYYFDTRFFERKTTYYRVVKKNAKPSS